MARNQNRAFQREENVDIHLNPEEFLPPVRSRSEISFLEDTNGVAYVTSSFQVDKTN